MTILAITVTLISSLFWGIFDGVRKHLVNKINISVILFFLSLGFTIFFLIFAVLDFIPNWSNAYLVPGLITVVLNLAANYLYIKAIKISNISSAVPFLAFTSLFTAVTAYVLLGQSLNLVQILGIFILVLGSLILNGKVKKGETIFNLLKNLWHSFVNEKGAHLMIAVSFLWALSAPFDKMAVEASSIFMHGFYQSLLITTMIFSYIVSKGHLINLKEALQVKYSLILGSFISCLALALQFFAYTLILVPVFESMKRGFALFTAMAISAIVFKEKITLFKIIGSVLIIVGAALIIL